MLRLVVFLLGGLSVDQVLHLFRALDLGVEPENVTRAIADLSAIGLLIVNSEHRDKVRVEHDIVSRVVTALTPEEEKVEFRQQLLDALVRMLDTQNGNAGDVTLYDRLLGVAHEFDVRASPALLAHIVNFLSAQHQEERFTYLATVFRDSVCWDVLDVIPAHVIEMLLNSLQRCSLFSFGLVAVGRLRSSTLHHSVAFLYEAKYLVQLFRYEEARSALANAPKSKAGALVDFNIMINQCEDEAAAKVASRVYGNISLATPSEHDLVKLRNSGHLFGPEKSRSVLKAAVKGFRRIGSKFGVATALNNLGIADLVVGDLEQAQNNLQTAKRMLEELGSPEVYQALVNLSALALKQMSAADAGRLLREAKSFAPRSLAMDMVMLEYNEAILSLLLGNKICDEGEILRFQNLHRTAARTRDIRFIDTLGWFVSRLELQVRGATETEFSSQIINRVLHSKTLGLEIFVGLNTANASIEAPYLLSPHWRH